MDSKSYPIAVDIENHDIRALQLEKNRGGLRIKDIFHQKLEKPLKDIKQSGPELLTALKTIKKQSRFKGNRAVIHIPTHKMVSFPIEFTIKKNETLDDAIIREVEQNLPFPLEEAVIDYPSIAHMPKENLYKIIIVCARRSDIEDMRSVFRKAGFWVDAVDFRPISSIRLHQHFFAADDKPGITCYVGREESSVQIFNADRIFAMNKFSWGLDQLINKLNINLGFETTTANALSLLRQHGIGPASFEKSGSDQGVDDPQKDNTGRIVSRIITPSIEELVFEFHKIIGYTRNKEEIHGIKDISFYGAAPIIKGLDQYIQSRMNIPATTINLLDLVDVKKALKVSQSHDITSFAVALGLALREIPWL